MAKANLKLEDGTTVAIEGTPEEVAAVLARFSGGPSESAPRRGRRSRRPGRGRTAPGVPRSESAKRATKGPVDYIRELIADGFFKSKRGLKDVRLKLEERAHVYPNTSLSPVLFRLVRDRDLRRIKEDGKWMYVNP